jgi:hypothetical protein
LSSSLLIRKCYLTDELNITCYVFNIYRCDFNKYTLQYIAKLGEIRSAMRVEEDMEIETVAGILPLKSVNNTV